MDEVHGFKYFDERDLLGIELPDGVQLADPHVTLNAIVDDDGTEHKIVRDNMPFGHVGSGGFGTYFIGYARTPEVTEQMRGNMFPATCRAAPTASSTSPRPSPAAACEESGRRDVPGRAAGPSGP